jgi:hypothetical protein
MHDGSAVTKVVEKDCHTVHQKLKSRFSVAVRKNPLESHVLVFFFSFFIIPTRRNFTIS